MSNQIDSPNRIIDDENLYQAFQMMKRKEYDNAEQFIKNGIKESRKNNDKALEGLYYSAMGVLYKLKQNYNKSYKFYQQAEKLLDDDASIKIISALLLIEQFKQYDIAIKKMNKVLEQTKDPAIWHHAMAIQAKAYFLDGKKDKAKENFKKILLKDFKELRFAANLDFKMVELFVHKKFMREGCQEYLKKALELAQSKKEKTYILIIEKLLKGI